jgi:hypothetical protein
MKSTYIAAAAASGIALALALATPPTFAEEQVQPAQIPNAQQDRPLGDAPADSQAAPMDTGQSLGQVKPAQALEGQRAEDIVGTKIVDDKGDEIAEVKEIVRSKATGNLHALVMVGGILGVGGTQLTIPLSEMELKGSQLISPLASNAEQLKAQPAYEQSFYESVPDEEKVAIGAVGAGAQTAAAPFGTLDADRDGYVSKDEAKDRADLTAQWERADLNRDDRLDQAEFAAFETAEPMAPAPGDVRHKGGERSDLD